tara:strand:- start:3273 stop:3515 length:243 start_codon:yes stop_codon:yes gene_type:complete
MREKYKCQFCSKSMSEQDHNFCDICGDCRDETNTMSFPCNLCGHENHIDNFKCEGEDCGIPLDLELSYNKWGLPELNLKK